MSPVALTYPRAARGLGKIYFIIMALCVSGAVGAGIVASPLVAAGSIAGLGLFAIGLLGTSSVTFPLLGFLLVFDSVFSLGTQVGSTGTVTLIGVSPSNVLLLGLVIRLGADVAVRREVISALALLTGGVLIGTAILSALVEGGGITRPTITAIGGGLTVLVVLSYRSPQLSFKMLKGVAVGAMVGGVSGLFTIATTVGSRSDLGRSFGYIGTNAQSLPVPRVSGLFQNPVALGFVVLVAVFTVLATFRRVLLRRLVVAVLLLSLAFTYSRGPMVGVGLGFLAFGAAWLAADRARRVRARPRWFSFVAFLGASGILVAILLVSASRSPSLAPYWNQDSIDFRRNASELALNAWARNPVLGIGPGNFEERYTFEVHDTFLALAAEMGTAAFAAMIGLTISSVVRPTAIALTSDDKELARMYRWIASAAVATAVVNASVSLNGVKVMWAVLACACIAWTRNELPTQAAAR